MSIPTALKFPVNVTFETRIPIVSKNKEYSIPCIQVGVVTEERLSAVAIISRKPKDDKSWFVIPTKPDTPLGQALLELKPDFMDLESLKDKVRSTIIKVNSTKE